MARRELDTGCGQGRSQRNKSSGTQSKDVFGSCPGYDCLHVFNLAHNAETIAVRAAQTSTAPIWQIQRESIGESFSQFREILRSFHAAMDENGAWTTA